MSIEIGKSVIDTEIKALKLLKKSLSQSFEKTISTLLKTKGKIVVSGIGKSSHIAKKISSTLSSVGTSSFFVHPAEANHGDLGMISKDESIIIISNSGETVELFNIIVHCEKLKIPIIAITSNKNSTLAKKCTILIEIPGNIEACPLELAPTSSSTMSLVLGDAISIALLRKKGFTKQDFFELHPGGKLGRILLKVDEIMKKKQSMPLIKSNKKMSEALIEMTSKGLGCVGVINEKTGILVGLITDGDLRRHMNSGLLDKNVKEVMTKNPKTLKPGLFIVDALEMMNKESITNYFITKNKKPIGILHMHDILRY
ncbi:MAG: KpsF/GutQ family sugar-phosphate isomerase [Rickettsiales bacterium]|nr:KpsF/GutQ family sugar-phosphate isomerase [Rickettsiales bacterium]|tara:strand:+ start:1506 stop:2447 length:942 start_codon:yes stop_codon:yes gene_type:complete